MVSAGAQPLWLRRRPPLSCRALCGNKRFIMCRLEVRTRASPALEGAERAVETVTRAGGVEYSGGMEGGPTEIVILNRMYTAAL